MFCFERALRLPPSCAAAPPGAEGPCRPEAAVRPRPLRGSALLTVRAELV